MGCGSSSESAALDGNAVRAVVDDAMRRSCMMKAVQFVTFKKHWEGRAVKQVIAAVMADKQPLNTYPDCPAQLQTDESVSSLMAQLVADTSPGLQQTYGDATAQRHAFPARGARGAPRHARRAAAGRRREAIRGAAG